MIAPAFRELIRWVYRLSPYCWLDSLLKRRENRCGGQPTEWNRWRERRKMTSEAYIVGWLLAAVALSVVSGWVSLPWWWCLPLLLRVLGIVNKELGVILFGICKITEGGAVAATGRTIVLALVNYLSAMFLFAASYQFSGRFAGVPAYLSEPEDPVGLVQAFNIQFTLNGPFVPADSWTLAMQSFQGLFCFMFGTMVISLFVSLLNVKPLNR